jgi:hypothetical protein
MRPRIASIAIVSAFLLFAAGASATADPPGADVRADAAWITQAQLADGAIATQVDRKRIWPYLGNFAASGLAQASVLTGDPAPVQAAWRWLRWYQAHQDARGFVTDYRVVHGREVSTGDMDSTDAYAGTFLLAVRAAWEATRDRLALTSVWPGVARAVRAIRATQDRDGLTWAKPTWHVKYLMDQSEAYAGLRAAAALARVLGARDTHARAARAATRLKHGVERTWNARTQSYDWAVHANGARQQTDWKVLYPDALEQLWAVAFGLVGDERARALTDRFALEQPNWDDPTATARFSFGRRSVGYWAPAAWAFARVGDVERSRSAAARIRAAAVASGRVWPFTPADAGQLIVLAGLGG